MLYNQIKTTSCKGFFLIFNVEAITNPEIYLIWKKSILLWMRGDFLEGNIVCFSKLDKKCHYRWDKHTWSSSRTVIHIAYIDKIFNLLSTQETPFHFRAISTCMRKSKRCVYKRVVKLKMLKYLKNFLLHFDDES